VGRDPVDLVDELGNLDLNLHAILGGVYAVRALHGELSHPVKDVLRLLEIALSRLNEGNAVLDVLRSLVEAADLAAEFFGDREAGSIVAGPVDALAGRKLFHVLRHIGLSDSELAIRIQRTHVVVDNHVTLLEET
jgi:hypothetical protein